MIWINKKLASFTLIESLLVLLIITIIWLMPVLYTRYWEENIQTTIFFQSFEQKLLKAQEQAIISGRPSYVNILFSNDKVDWHFFKLDQQPLEESLNIPTKVTGLQDSHLVFLAYSGNISQIIKLTFTDHQHQEKIVYQFQLGSGKYEKKISRIPAVRK
ncbi:competence type IV pilus minor pilin ComGD [Vagococcus humatus]|uniref:Prepilin-type cleavage/methylation domain-containing protein n=1 Tax=Vagococcus humatus TaxID=1889241 RepID=A0A3S0ABW9_9ENTE|nr:competence type IV pilus minor pilin ComGD [Vagococcus humatus]RST89275.1 hypothetical protein C7P63_05740 [Vagococcus humatus]